MKDKNINRLGIAMGTASYCKTCKALMLGGVNNPEVAKSLGIKGPKAWNEFLKGHEEYHKAKGEEIPEAWTVRAFDVDMQAAVEGKELRYEPKPRYVPTEEELAIREFKLAMRPRVKQGNGREDNRPVLKPFDTKPFAGL